MNKLKRLETLILRTAVSETPREISTYANQFVNEVNSLTFDETAVVLESEPIRMMMGTYAVDSVRPLDIVQTAARLASKELLDKELDMS